MVSQDSTRALANADYAHGPRDNYQLGHRESHVVRNDYHHGRRDASRQPAGSSVAQQPSVASPGSPFSTQGFHSPTRDDASDLEVPVNVHSQSESFHVTRSAPADWSYRTQAVDSILSSTPQLTPHKSSQGFPPRHATGLTYVAPR